MIFMEVIYFNNYLSSAGTKEWKESERSKTQGDIFYRLKRSCIIENFL